MLFYLRYIIFFLVLLTTPALATEEAVQLKTSTGVLHGTLDLPSGAPPYSVVIIIGGSGPTDRDGNQPKIQNDGLKQLGRGLAAKGIAVLRCDKRGIGQSASAMRREDDLRFETFVADAVQWLSLLRRDSRFSRVGIIGHSEGSLIGMAAANPAKIDAFVSIAGSGRPAAALIREQLGRNLPPNLNQQSSRILDELVAGRSVADVPKELADLFRPTVQPYLISWFKYDPPREIGALRMPVLILQGTTDLQVSIEDARRLAAANKDAKLRLIDGMNHVLKRAATPAEQQAAYTETSRPIDAQVVEEIADFLFASAAKQPRPPR